MPFTWRALNSATPQPDPALPPSSPAASPSRPPGFNPGLVRPHGDSISESRPPFPLFVDDVQPPPAQYGRESYTTRPPWMAMQQTLIDGRSLTATCTVDGASLSPFPVAPAPLGDADNTAVVQAARISAGEAIEVARGVAVEASLQMAAPRRRGSGSGAFTMLFILAAKSIPVLLVLGAGGYTYSYFFGTPPFVEAMRRKITSEPAPAVDARAPKSKAGQMMLQTREVVAANDARINFANELAEAGANLDVMSGPVAANPNAPIRRVTAAVITSSPATRTQTAPTAPVSLRSQQTHFGYDASLVVPGRVDLPSPVRPSVAFVMWVDRVRITGLRAAGDESKIIVNDLTVVPGEIIDHAQGIVVDGVDMTTGIVRFRDRTGAIIGKRF